MDTKTFDRIEGLWPSQSIRVISSWSDYLATLFLGRLSLLVGNQYLCILSPETDNCPSWISRREIMTLENISWSISMKECCWTQWRSNQSDAHSTEPPRPAEHQMFYHTYPKTWTSQIKGNGYAYKGGNSVITVSCFLSEKGSTLKGIKEICFAEMQTGGHNSCLPCEEWWKSNECIQSP